ncbi:Serine/threonine protein kinase [Streptomyces sp. LamerLS-316]|uniref:protein kinase domain-containing protein n=1 Tax=unclassified Streptomyces TaxID=2593676 RepID=UPI000823CFBC|nr:MULTISPECIES: protein kinase [unclassified Streptomyces]MYQ39459.1 protein kinase [Streptomyces sp. SID4921]SCK43122.1 Serine/threonine protein kinase [Streptomyces sp. LamerLS-316]
MAALEPLDPSDPPRTGPYTLLGRLGTGGMGTVYLGRSAGGRTVAVKTVRPELAADAGFRARFGAEVRAARTVSGAFTAPVVDADPEAPVPWMATAFVPGISLGAAVAAGGPLPGRALVALAAGVAEALTSIHAARLTHRDLKPGNVLLALDGPHVIDFGIARAADGTALTATGTILGTPAYMSPEQATDGEVGPASDVFSLGATLAFAARGSGLFDGGQPVEVLKRVVREEPDLSAVPESLRLLVAACLAKNPADRPAPRQIVEYVERSAAPRTEGPWLPPAVMDAIEEATAVMAPTVTARPQDPAPPFVLAPPPGPPAYPPPPLPPGPPAGPSRRGLIMGLAAGAVTLAGGGTALGLWLGGEDSPGTPADAKRSAPGLTDDARPLDTDVEATPLWTGAVSEPLVQISGENGTVVGFSAKRAWAFDRAGKRVWGPLANLPDPVNASFGGLVAAVDNGFVYSVVRAGPGEQKRVFRAIRLDTGAVAWTLELAHRSASSVTVTGILDGQVHLTGNWLSLTLDPSLDPKDIAKSGTFVCSVDPAARKVGWQLVLTSTETQANKGELSVPSSGTRLLWTSANTDGSAPTIAGLDTGAKGKVVWEQPSPGAGASSLDVLSQGVYGPWRDGQHTSAGGFFLHVTDRLYAIDPDNGQVAWKSPELAYKAVVASPDGKTVYAAAGTGLAVVVHALDARTGKVRWAGSLFENASGIPHLQCADDTVHVCTGDRLWALDSGDGKARWTAELDSAVTYGQLPFFAGDGLVYATGPKGLMAFASKGRAAS